MIGNADYQSVPRRNPENDAKGIAEALKSLGFEVIIKLNPDYAEMNQVVDQFGEQLTPEKIGLFYFAGHGVQHGGRNYLIPVKANIQKENEMTYRALDAGLVLAKMESTRNRLNIVVFDSNSTVGSNIKNPHIMKTGC